MDEHKKATGSILPLSIHFLKEHSTDPRDFLLLISKPEKLLEPSVYKVLKTSHGLYSGLSLTSLLKIKSPHSGRVRETKGFECVPPKNPRFRSNREQMWLWTDKVTNPLQSMFENTFSAGPLNVSFLFSLRLQIPPSQKGTEFSHLPLSSSQTNKPNNKHLFHGNVTRIELENLAAVEKHFIPPSILPFHSV